MFTGSEDMEANALTKRGWSISAISRHLGWDRKRVRAYLNGEREVGRRGQITSDRLGALYGALYGALRAPGIETLAPTPTAAACAESTGTALTQSSRPSPRSSRRPCAVLHPLQGAAVPASICAGHRWTVAYRVRRSRKYAAGLLIFDAQPVPRARWPRPMCPPHRRRAAAKCDESRRSRQY